MKTLTLKIDARLHQQLENEAQLQGRSKSAIVREALEKSLRNNATPSCHNLMIKACGTLKDAPKDLATNKKYLKNFGKQRRVSVTEAAGSLVGRYASGRKDSSHKKHLKHFGMKRPV